MPKSIDVDPATATDTYAKFTAAPLESGFGHTLGNALRRIMLTALDGSAISAVRIDGAPHEFTTLPGIVEDVTEIVLNLKRVRLNCHGETPKTLEIRKDQPGVVTAADILSDGTVEVINGDQVICTIDKKMPFRAEVEISSGRGWRPAEKNKKADHPIGTITVDAMFGAVTRVRYQVGATRVGEETEMDRLHIEVWTDGRMTPVDALTRAAGILQDHLQAFLGGPSHPETNLSTISEDEQKMFKLLIQGVDTIELSVRAQNCLNNAEIRLIGELCQKTEPKMLKYRNFGKKSLEEIKERLAEMGLSLGMVFSDELSAIIEAEIAKLKDQQEGEGE
jgi:DNA-directed RNA polymerase subunit alpha